MLVIINALKSITRSKGRNILIGIIVITIAASSCVALAIKNAASEAETAGLSLLNLSGSISLDRSKMMEEMQGSQNPINGNETDMSAMRDLMAKYQDLNLSELLNYADSDYLKEFYYSASISLNAGGELEAYGSEENTGNNNIANHGFPGGGGGRGNAMMGGMTMGDFTVTGYSNESAMTKFIDGTSKITEGEMLEVSASDMKCLISNELALFNGLSVGDSIILTNPSGAEDEDGTLTETYTLSISGIYTDSSSGNGSQMRFSTSMDPANLICISYASLDKIINESNSVAVVETNDSGVESSSALSMQISGTYLFSSQEDFDNFSKEIYEKGLDEYYTLTSSEINNYEISLTPLKNLSKFATTLLLIVLAIGALILVVINIFNIRERKYEVGVLTAMGIKKTKVAMQFVMELLSITLFAIIIGVAIGAVISTPISNNLLSSQIEQMETISTNQDENFGRPNRGGNFGGNMGGDRQNFQPGGIMEMFSNNQRNVTYIDKINASVNFEILGQLILIGIILTLISSFAAVIFVMRYEPLKILANRS